MTPFVLPLENIRAADVALVGGKGANLGEMTAAGFPVPPGFCVTTRAYRAFTAPIAGAILSPLKGLDPADLDAIRQAGEQVRAAMMRHALPGEVVNAIIAQWRALGPDHAYAVRSSATAEDLPGASFAGQQDTYLNVIGEDDLVEKVRRCFVSLFTDRAILYRIQQGFAHEKVALSVVVQRMVRPDVSGILFTADPISENRRICSIDASFGLGEALVSGLVSADLYKVDKRTGRVVAREIADKAVAIEPLAKGGTRTVQLSEADRTRAVLDDAGIAALVDLGKRVEAHYGAPQDIEWALQDGALFLTQARPITSLYPLAVTEDDDLHVFLSLSHLQVMTDPIPPLSIAIYKYFSPIGLNEHGEYRYIQGIGGRVYADIGPVLRHPVLGRLFVKVLAVADAIAQAAVRDLLARKDFRARGERLRLLPLLPGLLPVLARVPLNLLLTRPEGAVDAANRLIAGYAAQTRRDIAAAPDARARLQAALAAWRGVLPAVAAFLPRTVAGLISGRLVRALAGAENDALLNDFERGMDGNVVTEMNLAIGDLADLARGSAALSAALRDDARDVPTRLRAAQDLEGGAAFLGAWTAFLDRFGARCPSEIDASRPRWREDPSSLLQMVVGMMARESPGAHRAHFRDLTRKSARAASELPRRLHGWGAWWKRPLQRRMIRVARNLGPLREHHKFLMVQVLAELRAVLSDIGADLVRRGLVDDPADIWFLTMREVFAALDDDAGDGPPDRLRETVAARRDELHIDARRTPPRVVTSEGEVLRPKLSVKGAPSGALIGSPVSAGIVEGVAHVVTDPASETLEPGEILVAPFTDPGWTPLFVNAAALVTEVGGLMTHGSVVAREYGIAAVVGVPEATRLIRTGDRIRVNGDLGYVELIGETAP